MVSDIASSGMTDCDHFKRTGTMARLAGSRHVMPMLQMMAIISVVSLNCNTGHVMLSELLGNVNNKLR